LAKAKAVFFGGDIFFNVIDKSFAFTLDPTRWLRRDAACCFVGKHSVLSSLGLRFG
jgi:hypothetical protein